MKNILVTGVAGFIGFHLCSRLVKMGYNVIGLDNINHYYDVDLKYARLKELGFNKKDVLIKNNIIVSSKFGLKIKFINIHLEDRVNLPILFSKNKFDYVCNLAAQAGVRYSIENPVSYIDSNIVGFLNILECCRNFKIKKLVYASSSSVYGISDCVPFLEDDKTDSPVSLYAATKKSNELMAFTYSHLYNLQTIGLRFFTVYGPWGRPDMAPMLFTKAILDQKELSIFNDGDLSRDFTYIDDIIDGTIDLLIKDIDSKCEIFNIGRSQPTKLLDFVVCLENELYINAKKIMKPMQPGDVFKTWASIDKLKQTISYNPKVTLKVGIKKFIKWYRVYYNLK
jgi:UDP-glucuronate 4-epimerase